MIAWTGRCGLQDSVAELEQKLEQEQELERIEKPDWRGSHG
jgi:hypothetical protein